MLILAIDTALSDCVAAVWRDGRVLAQERVAMSQGQAEALMPMVERVMAAAGVRYDEVMRIAVTCGPGSFTGVRIGLAAARGLALAGGGAAVGVTTTEALAAAVPADEREPGARILAVVDSKRGDVFAQLFARDGAPLTAIENLPFAALAALVGSGDVIVVGDAAAPSAAALGTHARISCAAPVCDPAVLSAIVAARMEPLAAAVPVYVRPPDVTVDPSGGRLRP